MKGYYILWCSGRRGGRPYRCDSLDDKLCPECAAQEQVIAHELTERQRALDEQTGSSNVGK